jgi:hypothetical protein
MCKDDLQAVTAEEFSPQNADLLALGDRVCGDESNTYISARDVLGRLEVPCCDVVQNTSPLYIVHHQCHITLLLCSAELLANEWRISEYITALLWWKNLAPVLTKSIGVVNVRGLLQREALIRLTERLGNEKVHLVIYQPECYFGNPSQ